MLRAFLECGMTYYSVLSCERMQAELADKAAELASAQEQHATSDADWEGRMKDAVSSAEQWKEFAEKLGAEKETLQSTLASTEHTLMVDHFESHHACCNRGTAHQKGLSLFTSSDMPSVIGTHNLYDSFWTVMTHSETHCRKSIPHHEV